MARQSKIEKYGCEDIVASGLRADPSKSTRQIAEECSDWAGEKISHTAIARYIETLGQQEQKQKKEVIKQDQRRVLKTVNQEFDIIQLQYQTTEKLLKRFDMVDNLPEFFKEQMDELVDKLMEQGVDVKYLERWQTNIEVELRRKVYEITSLNRELRENSKFLAELREKAFEFSLIQEYLSIFMDIFRESSPQGYEVAIQKVAANPRMQKIVDQQMQLRSDG
jgi:predicted RNase H-like nuclease (RuvC/YqgF family)